MQSTDTALLVDLDGTLIDTAPDMVAALERLCQREGRPAPNRELARNAVSNGSIALLNIGFGEAETSARRDELLPAFLADYTANVASSGSALFGGWEAVLAHAEANAIPWGIVTNKPEAISRRLLAELELDTRCGSLIGGDTLPVRKPDPAPLFAAAVELGIAPGNAIYVGDHKRDIDAGRAAGMLTVAASWGYIVGNDSADDWHADHVATTPDDILALLAGRAVA